MPKKEQAKNNILEKKVDTLDKKVGVLDIKVDTLDKKVGVLDKKVDTLAKGFDQHCKEDKAEHKKIMVDLKKEMKDSEERVLLHFDVLAEALKDEIKTIAEQYGSIRENMEIMKDDAELMKAELYRKTDYADFTSLEQRVTVLEKKVA